MKRCSKIITLSLISGCVFLNLSACSSMMTSKMPKGSVSMQDAYNAAIYGDTPSNDQTLAQVRKKLSRQVLKQKRKQKQKQKIDAKNSHYFSMNNETLFSRLPNPTIRLYVFPHEIMNGDERIPVPGYVTVFSLYLTEY